MRLLNASTVELHEFAETEVPKYAILSHRWGKGEVSTQELKTMVPGSSHSSEGYQKIKGACALAEHYQLEYIWIDTCCIDKTSSAELSEAINSMYRWYAQSVLCFVHLADIELRPSARIAPIKFVGSEWFERGWTLQELLAPDIVLFFDTNWQEMGTRSALASYITEATTIGPEFLRLERDFRTASIAQRMSWASRRKTTRVEDIAYCLMGLFDVNMPLLYGEGKKAFLRLQQELISNCSDESIYAWYPTYDEWHSGKLTGMLASAPDCFETSGRIVSIELPGMRQTPFSITNRGIAMTLPSLARKRKKAEDDRSISYIGDVTIGGGFEIPLACANVDDIQAPLKLSISQYTNESYARNHVSQYTNGSYARNHVSDGLQFFTHYNVKGLKMKTLHVPLSFSHQYPRQLSKETSLPKLVTIQLRPAAQAVLHLLGNRAGVDTIYSISEEPPLWQCEFWGRKEHVLEFQYKEQQLIHLVCTDYKVGLHVEDICKVKGCREYGNNETTMRESSANTSTILATKSPGQDACERDQNSAINKVLPTSAGNPLWEQGTYIDWGGCQSRPLDESYLWLSTRKLKIEHGRCSGHREHHIIFSHEYILDLDISTIDRRSVF